MADIDPNVYALSISLSLDTGDAFDELDLFGDTIGKIEQDVASAAQKSMSAISSTGAQATKSLDSMQRLLTSILSTSGELSDNLKIAADSMGSSDPVDTASKMYQYMEKEQGELEKMHKQWVELTQILENKNALHQDEIGHIEKEQEEISEMFESWTDVVALVGSSLYLLDRWANKLATINKDTEKFTNTNYRLYGSQVELLNATRGLTAEYGIFYDTALEAMQVLGDLRVPRNELEQYSKMVGMMHRVTGVAVPAIAQYANNLRQVGRNATGVEDHLLKLQENMRKFSLSAESMGKVLDQTTFSARDLEFIFSDDNAPEKYANMQVELTALAKSFGVANFEATEFDSVLSNTTTMGLWQQTLGRAIKTTDDFRQATFAMADTLGEEMLMLSKLESPTVNQQKRLEVLTDRYFGGSKALRDYAMALKEAASQDQQMIDLSDKVAKARDPAEIQKYKKQLLEVAEARGIDRSELSAHIKKMQEFAKNGKPLLKNLEYQNELMEKAKKEAMDPFSESNDTLIAQLKMLKERFWAIIHTALTPLIKAVKTIVKGFNAFLDVILKIGEWINKWIIEPLNKLTGGVFSKFIDWIMLGIVVVGGLALAIAGLAIAFGILGPITRWVTSAIVGFFKGIGEGLAAMAKAIGKQIFVLMGLAAAFLMVGAGAWLFAQSLKTVAEYGLYGVLVFGAFLTVLTIFIAILVGLAALAQGPVAAGLLAIGATLLMIGAAAWLVGQSMMAMANAMMIVVSALARLGQGGVLVDFSEALVEASWNILKGAPVLYLAAMALMAAAVPFAIASSLLAIGTAAFAFAVWMIGNSADKFETAMGSLAAGVNILVALPIGNAIVAIGKLIVMGAGLLVAAAVLAPGAMALGAAGWLFQIGMEGLLAGYQALQQIDMATFVAQIWKLPKAATALLVAGALFIPGAVLLGSAALLLGTGLQMLAWGVNAIKDLDFAAAAQSLAEGSLELIGVGPILFVAATALQPAAMALFTAGALIALGANWIASGADAIQDVGQKFKSAGPDLKEGSEAILDAIPLIWKAAAQLFWLAPALFISGVRLAAAGFWFNIGASFLASAVHKLAKEGDSFSKFADGMEKFAEGANAMMSLDPKRITDIADAMELAAPKMKSSMKELVKLAPMFKELSASLDGLDANTDPLMKIATSLDIIDQAILQLNENADKLIDNLTEFGPQLEAQAEQIEKAARRIDEAVQNRGIPAMRAAQDAGLADVAAGDVIATVQVLPNQEGREGNRQDELLEAQNTYLERIAVILEAIQGGDDTKNIHELLSAVLPRLADSDSSELFSRMNQWTG